MADEPAPEPPAGQVLIYQDGGRHLRVRLDGQTVWLPQRLIAELFQVTVPNVNQHLKAIYEEEIGLKSGDDVIAYCRIGERSSHTWFVLKYLLGYDQVRNYDGSWTEWGNLVGAPIEK